MRRNLFRKGRPGPNVPPLGWGDISLYLLGMLLSGGLGAALLLVMVLYWDRVCALADPEALTNICFISYEMGDDSKAAVYCKDALQKWRADTSPDKPDESDEEIQNLLEIGRRYGIGGN